MSPLRDREKASHSQRERGEPVTGRPGCSAEIQRGGHSIFIASNFNMADEELAAIRAKRMQEIQSQYGVCSVQITVFHFITCLMYFFVKCRVKIRHKCNNNKRPYKGLLIEI